jgi:hypothetical protein
MPPLLVSDVQCIFRSVIRASNVQAVAWLVVQPRPPNGGWCWYCVLLPVARRWQMSIAHCMWHVV